MDTRVCWSMNSEITVLYRDGSVRREDHAVIDRTKQEPWHGTDVVALGL